jgi:uncharacterized membrane protein YvlD (DUF360 family)
MGKWVIGLAIAFVLLTIISGVAEGTYMSSEDATLFWTLLHPQIQEVTNPITAVSAVFNLAGDYIRTLIKMLIFDYSFLQGGYVIFRYLFCCVSLGLIVTLVLSLVGKDTSG